MAVTLSSADPLYYAALFGVKQDVITQAKACSVQVVASLGALKVQGINGNIFGTIAVKGSALTLAKNGNMGPASKQVIQHQLEKALVSAIAATGGPSMEVSKIDTTGMSAGEKAAVTKAMKNVILADAPKLKVPVKMFNPGKEVTSEKPLAQATTLYEPVAGSTSVYNVVAMYPGLNVAMRRTHSKISLRCEGANLPNKKPVLSKLGFDDHGGYVSVHFDVTDNALTQKTVGALIGLLGFSDAIAIGDPLKIGVGN